MALQFNLLPWRSELRKKKLKRNKGVLIGAVVLGLCCAGGYYGFEQIRLDDHKEAEKYIKRKNVEVQKKLEEHKRLLVIRERLQNQIASIQSLQDHRSSASHMLEELSIANNQELFLSEFSLLNGTVNISGIAENESEISDLMKKLTRSDWYESPRVAQYTSDKKYEGKIKNFDINSNLVNPESISPKGGQ